MPSPKRLILPRRFSLQAFRVLRCTLLVAIFLAAFFVAALPFHPARAFASSPNAPQADSANSPAARQLHAWLDAFNSGDRAVFLAFLQKNYPDDAKRIDGLMRFRSMTGGFELKKIEKSDDTHISAILKEHDSDQFAHLEIEVDPAEPHQIKHMDLNAIATPAEFPSPRMAEDQAIAALRSEIDRQVAADHFSGAVMVAKNGKTVFSGAYGLADREKKIKNDLNTRFRIGSMNKMFTAVATLQLVQAGKIKLTAPLGDYLPDYPNKDIAAKVTIHHLLTHTGGTGDFFGPEFDKHRLELKTLQDYLKLYGARGPEFEPGSKWEYSNYGFLLLGVIVQKVSGEDYYDYVHKHVFAPAGMTSTDSLPEEQNVAQRSVGYTKMDGEAWRPNTDTLPYRGTSAGGGYSTVEDLQRFADALLNHKLLDAHYTDLLTTGKVDTGGGGDKYAYGFMDRTTGGVRSFGHGGGAPGMNGDLTIYPQSGYVVAVLANLDPPAAQRIAAFIGNRLPEK
jgi:D-alanyl-D-alanine carboxypeptidase